MTSAVLTAPTNATGTRLPVVLVYRNELLHPSETFVRSQAEGMENYQPVFVGRKRVPGLELKDQSWTVDSGGVTGRVKRNLHKYFGFAPGMPASLKRLNPALIHCHFGVDSVSAIRLARSLRIPLVVTYHGYDATMREEYAREFSYDYRRYLGWKRVLQSEVDRFIAVSEFVRDKLITQSFPSTRIVVHYVGVDTGRFRPNRADLREPIVLFAGRLAENKGCDYLIDAMSLVQQRLPHAKLVVIGDGPERHSLERLATFRLKNYEFLGMQSQEILRQWMTRATVFSVPSVTVASGASEGFGLVFAEAQAMGTPVASFATGGIPEAVLHGVTGLLAPERDIAELAGNITRLLSDASLWQQFSLAGIRRVRKDFDLHTQNAKLEAIYADVIARHRASLQQAS